MEKNLVYLSYYEVMVLTYEFEEIRNEHQGYLDLLFDQYYDYFLEQIEFNVSRFALFNVPDIVLKNLKIYSMSASLYALLLEATGINFEDKKFKKYYKNYIKSYEDYLFSSQKLDDYKKLIKKNK